jgi:hypothetical protein
MTKKTGNHRLSTSVYARAFGRVAAAGLMLGVAAALGCSSSSAGAEPCNENPWECPAGQTCWPKDDASFACLDSGPGTAGDACLLTPGSPTCSDGLECLMTSAAGGTCTPYCDDTDTSHACPAGQSCAVASLSGGSSGQFRICTGASTVTSQCCIIDPGADAGGTPSCWCGSGSSASGVSYSTTVTGSSCTVTLTYTLDGGPSVQTSPGTVPTSASECAADLPIGG